MVNKYSITIDNCRDCSSCFFTPRPPRAGEGPPDYGYFCRANGFKEKRLIKWLDNNMWHIDIPNWCPHLPQNQNSEIKEQEAVAFGVLTEEELRLIKVIIQEKTFAEIYTLSEFEDAVSVGAVKNGEGTGYLTDIMGREFNEVHCDVEWLEMNREYFPFVKWYES